MRTGLTVSALMTVAFCAGAAVSLFGLPLYVATIVNVAKEGSRSDWLGFSGGALGAFATLLAASIALYAAYRTLRPMRQQLQELIRQNDHLLHERLQARAQRLNEEEILLTTVAASCEVVAYALRAYRETAGRIGVGGMNTAVNQLGAGVSALQKQTGSVWGNGKTQQLRREYTDRALRAGSLAINILRAMEASGPDVFRRANGAAEAWPATNAEVHKLAIGLHDVVRLEISRVGQGIEAIEKRLLFAH